MRDEIERYTAAGVRPFGVNPGSLESHQRYVAKFGFPFPLLVDEGEAVADAYGARKHDRGIQRTVVLVRRDGTVCFAERGSPGAARSLPALATES